MKQTNSNQKAFGGEAKLSFLVENQTLTTEKQYLTGSEIKQLANLPKESELFLSLPEPWKDEPILDQNLVDLARPEIEHFYIKRELVYTINGKEFGSAKQYIKGAVIRKQGSIPASDEIYMAIKKPWEDELIKDDELIDLARPGIEHF